MIALLLTTVAGWSLSMLLRKLILAMIDSSGLVRPNYRGEQIPVAVGVLLSLIAALVGTALAGFGLVSYRLALAYCALVLGFGLVGLIDDLVGSRERSGLKGHLMALLRERTLTTGGLKALYGGLLAVLVALVLGGSAWVVFLRAIVIALSANLINLLDLRPGRAIKGFLAVVGVAAIGAAVAGALLWQGWALLAGLVGATLAYAPLDLKARAMMGDAGSNVLGAGAGFAICLTEHNLGVQWLFVWLVLLVGVHAYAERYSITKTIEAIPLLRAIDGLGRGKE